MTIDYNSPVVVTIPDTVQQWLSRHSAVAVETDRGGMRVPLWLSGIIGHLRAAAPVYKIHGIDNETFWWPLARGLREATRANAACAAYIGGEVLLAMEILVGETFFAKLDASGLRMAIEKRRLLQQLGRLR